MSLDNSVAADVLDRFLRYVQIDTQSAEDSSRYPSTEKQLVLLRLLADELKEIGLAGVAIDQYGYVTATLPPTVHPARSPELPAIGFLAHVDTSPSVTGANVRPQVIRYAGGDIALPAESSVTIKVSDYPDLGEHIGHDIITTDGTTLLGADDKAGVAEIMAAMAYLRRHPEIPHGVIRVGFTPDEEVGRGTEHFDLAAFGAKYAYTMDGGVAGEVEDETFCADSATVILRGRNVHAGYAKDKLVNSLKLAADLIGRLPRGRLSPETTAGREGYLHPMRIDGTEEETRIKFIVRDFAEEGLRGHEDLLRSLVAEVAAAEPRAQIEVKIEETYRNMKIVLDRYPDVVANAEEAIRRSGLAPVRRPIRGGTDGAHLSFAGLPTANIFTGGHAFHSKQEWVCLDDMVTAVEVIVELGKIWARE